MEERDTDFRGQDEELIPLMIKKPLKEIERSIVKTYRKHICKFIKAIKEYEL